MRKTFALSVRANGRIWGDHLSFGFGSTVSSISANESSTVTLSFPSMSLSCPVCRTVTVKRWSFCTKYEHVCSPVEYSARKSPRIQIIALYWIVLLVVCRLSLQLRRCRRERKEMGER
ncbi:uncharacterized protein BT62DRAFT_462718 [Guyanagaster necrorhizus]|uniref:Uncharacterized protein n=1 Tax=Guyanagaster necrorhizus TaxID=856835 RepID=A0A9P7VJR5_9AGAR|nr:uncharacterized protein BT62DRAFT_462718 [Guyanagaster necrorhizus MCA 3950]KAG7441984.1 hypothetical protein BT62DRAFT_462718 [Guyanagaster necrorhizus MCA 3950]